MSGIKIITHTSYTYETSDGREFEDELEARDWELALAEMKKVVMLDFKFKPTTEIDTAAYVHIKDYFQLKAFNLIQKYHGLCANILETGYWYYDERLDIYINIDSEIQKLESFKNKLNSKETK